MEPFEDNTNNIIYDDEINLSELFSIFWKDKVLILTLIAVFACSSILYSLSLPNVYKSQALLSPSEDESNIKMASKFGGLAGLAGISVPNEAGNKSTEAIARINSFEFFENFFLPNILTQDLVAVVGWEPNSNILKYDDSVFDSEKKEWIFDNNNLSSMPSNQEAYLEYKDILSVSQEQKTGFVTISVKHPSPYIAKEWTDLIINEINRSMRDIERRRASKSIDFLNNQFLRLNYDEIKESIANLLEEEMKSLMLTEADDDFVFKTINSAIVPERKFEPRRSVIVIVSTMLGFMIGAVLSLIMHFMRNNSKN
jgi:capsular polysaccharide biosynthesis protein